MAKQTVHICWFRRDLRLHDNAALYHALKEGIPVVPIFIFDRSILDKLEDKQDRRVEFIHLAIAAMQQQLQQLVSWYPTLPNKVSLYFLAKMHLPSCMNFQ